MVNSGRFALIAILLAVVPALRSQPPRPLEWRLEQQPSSAPCPTDDFAFVNAPEQVALERSYNLLPNFPTWKCKSIKAPAFNQARVVVVYRLSVLDDGEGFALVQPQGSTNTRLLFLPGGLSEPSDPDDLNNRAAMSAILQTTKYGQPKTIDWLALSLAYLAILDEAPDLADEHYSPGPGEDFKSYTVPGLLSEVPSLTSKHLLPTVACKEEVCKVHFYYRTDPVMPLKVADFRFGLEDGTITLWRAEVQDYGTEAENRKKACAEIKSELQVLRKVRPQQCARSPTPSQSPQ